MTTVSINTSPQAKRQHTDAEERAATWFAENNWSIVASPQQLEQCVSTAPATLRIPRSDHPLSKVEAMISLIPLQVWVVLERAINRNLASANPADTRYKPTTMNELLRFYSIQILIENTYGNNTKSIRDHFKILKKDGIPGSGKPFEVKGIGLDRFVALKAALIPTVEELKEIAQLLSTAACSLTRNMHVCAIDESVIAYSPVKSVKDAAENSGEPIPVVYIPRKPHPNGLEAFLAATYVEDSTSVGGIPWIVGIYPHLTPGDESLAFRSLVSSVPFNGVHWIADARFSSEENIRAVQLPSTYTFSISSIYNPDLWTSLSAVLPVGNWRAATNGNLVASCQMARSSEAQDITTQRILTNGFVVKQRQCESVDTAEIVVSTAISGGQDNQVQIPLFTKESLTQMKGVDLKEICKRWGIRSGNRKLYTVSAILRRVAIIHRNRSKIEQLKEDLVRKRFESVAKVHVLYKEHFNWVDLADRRWGSVEEHHHHRSWKTKYALMLMRI